MTKKKDPKDLLPRGQPTAYRPEYCELLKIHMAEGLSFESFAADCDVSYDTLYEWERVHPEFSEAKKIGEPKNYKFWTKLGRDGSQGKIEGFNASAWIFTMKNRFNWNQDSQPNAIPFSPDHLDKVREELDAKFKATEIQH